MRSAKMMKLWPFPIFSLAMFSLRKAVKFPHFYRRYLGNLKKLCKHLGNMEVRRFYS